MSVRSEPPTILVPLDFTQDSPGTLKAAVERARSVGAALHLLFVIRPPTMISEGGQNRPHYPPAPTPQLADQHLKKLAAAHPDMDITTAVVVGRPAEAILQTASQLQARAIMVSRSTHESLLRVLATQDLDRYKACPIIAVEIPSVSA
ncbi:MAG TPA: universal stress protein [Candidatus Xenobia bacterium]|jgi:nucleotide-binding universal stress UspA family protein